MPNSESKKTPAEMQNAQHNIEILAMLQEKTKGNLTAQETQLISSVLYDLRLKYVEANKHL